MRLIFKSYLKTFFKNTFTTLGTLLFITMLITSVVGLISPFLQVQSKVSTIEKQLNKYDYSLKEKNVSSDILFHYYYNYDNEKDIISKPIKNNFVLDQSLNSDKNPFLNDIFTKEWNSMAYNGIDGNQNFGKNLLLNENGIDLFDKSDDNLQIKNNKTQNFDIDKSNNNIYISTKSIVTRESIDNQLTHLFNSLPQRQVPDYYLGTDVKKTIISINKETNGLNLADDQLNSFLDVLANSFINGAINYSTSYKDLIVDQSDKYSFQSAWEEYFAAVFASGYLSTSNLNSTDKDEIDSTIFLSDEQESSKWTTSSSFEEYEKTIKNLMNDITKVDLLNLQNFKTELINTLKSVIELLIKNGGDFLIFKTSSLEAINSSFYNLLLNKYSGVNTQYLLEHLTKLQPSLNENLFGNNFQKISTNLGIYKEDKLSASKNFDLVFKDGQTKVDNAVVLSGRKIVSYNEVIISEAYAKFNGIKIGDEIALPQLWNKDQVNEDEYFSNQYFNKNFMTDLDLDQTTFISRQYIQQSKFFNEIKLKVVGLGIKSDDIFDQTAGSNDQKLLGNSTDYKKRGFIYTSTELNEDIFNLKRHMSFKNNKYTIYTSTPTLKFKWNSKMTFEELLSKSLELANPDNIYSLDQFNQKHKIYFINSYETALTAWADNGLNSKMAEIKIELIIYAVLSIVAAFLSFVFLNFTIKKEMNETRVQLGIFKAMGYKTGELSWIFSIKIFLNIVLGILLGFVCSIPFQKFTGQSISTSVAFQYHQVYFGTVFLLFLFSIIPLTFLLISYLLTLTYLKESSLSLMKNVGKDKKGKIRKRLLARILEKRDLGFTYRLRIAFVSRNKGKFIITQALFGVSALLFSLLLGARAIMVQTIKEGFSVIKKDTDHFYKWNDYNSLTNYGYSEAFVNNTEEKFSLNETKTDKEYNQVAMKYIPYQGDDINSFLNNSTETKFSYSRYGLSMLMDGISKHINELKLTDEGQWFNYVTNLYDDSNLGKETMFDDVLRYKIIAQKPTDQLNQFIDQNYINDQKHASYSDIQKNMTKLEYYDDKVFDNTIIGMKTLDNNGMYNNFYLSDLGKFLSVILIKVYTAGKIVDLMSQNVQGDNIMQILKHDSIIKNYNPNDQSYWSLKNNPLLSFDTTNITSGQQFKNELLNFSTKNNQILTKNNLSQSLDITGILNNVPSQLLEILFESMMMKKVDQNYNPVVTINSLLFDSEKESLDEIIPVLLDDDKNQNHKIKKDKAISLDLIDTTTNFGDQRKQYEYKNVDQDKIDGLRIQNDDGSFNAIISYIYARKNNLHIGDTISLRANSFKDYLPFDIKISAINEAERFDPISGDNLIKIDYTLFARKMFDSALIRRIFAIDKETPFDRSDTNLKLVNPIFNHIWSKNPSLKGKLDINNVSSSFLGLQFVGKVLSINQKNDTNIFASTLNVLISPLNLYLNLAIEEYNKEHNTTINFDIIDIFDKKYNIKFQKSDFNIITNVGISNQSTVGSIVLLRGAIDDISKEITLSLIIFIVLQSILLIIILSVIMTIIIDEYTAIILTLKASGYSKRKINWIVMGSYIIGVLFSFTISYIITLVVWQVVAHLVANYFSIYLTIGFDWQSLLITVSSLSLIMLFGWFAANSRVNKKKLTNITNV